MAKIQSVKDLVSIHVEKPKQEIQTSSRHLTKLRGTSNRSIAAQFLGIKPQPEQKAKPSPKELAKRNNFINPSSAFATPTLLKKLHSDGNAKIDVAKAQTTLTKAQVQAIFMEDQMEAAAAMKEQNAKKRIVRSAPSFSRVPRTIENLMK